MRKRSLLPRAQEVPVRRPYLFCLLGLLALLLPLLLGVSPAAAQGWSETGSMSTAREGHTATLLSNGQVLVAGGEKYGFFSYDLWSSAEVYDPEAGTWSETGSMSTGRYWHTATLLPDGRVLVAGGSAYPSPPSSAEVYDPETGTWSETGSMSTARAGHTATLLPDGRVLVVGGSNYLSSAEVYDPETGTWSETGNMRMGRTLHKATLLADGRVLVAGGYNSIYSLYFLSSAEVYDPETGTWSTTGNMSTGRYFHTATLLSDGRVLVAGGFGFYWSSTEVYDPETGTWSDAGNLSTGHVNHTATLLSDGRVLVAGGTESVHPRAEIFYTTATAELYTP